MLWAVKNWKILFGGIAVVAVLLFLWHIRNVIYDGAVEDVRNETIEKTLEQEVRENEIEDANAIKSDAAILDELRRYDLRDEI